MKYFVIALLAVPALNYCVYQPYQHHVNKTLQERNEMIKRVNEQVVQDRDHFARVSKAIDNAVSQDRVVRIAHDLNALLSKHTKEIIDEMRKDLPQEDLQKLANFMGLFREYMTLQTDPNVSSQNRLREIELQLGRHGIEYINPAKFAYMVGIFVSESATLLNESVDKQEQELRQQQPPVVIEPRAQQTHVQE